MKLQHPQTDHRFTPSHIPTRTDVVIVGARVAGASLALLLARAGMRVLLVDRMKHGSDTMSTHALMRGGVMQLQRWGLLDRILAAGTPGIRRTCFHYGSEVIPVEIRERGGVDALISPRRNVLDPILASAAREAGARILFETKVQSLIRNRDGRINGVVLLDSQAASHTVRAQWVIGADGILSSIAREVGAWELATGSHCTATLYGYWYAPDLDATHWLYGNKCAGGATPTNGGAACVFATLPPERIAAHRPSAYPGLMRNILREMDPSFAQRFEEREPLGRIFPFTGMRGFIRQSWGAGWALVGDAGCFKDPLTAHGMTDALRDAELLANALLDGSDSALSDYQEQRDHFASEFLDLSDAIGSFDWTLDSVKPMHHALSRLMNRECDFIESLPDAPLCPSPTDVENERLLASCLLDC